MMKYLVLGSSGLIGSELCSQLISAGHETFLFDIENNAVEDLRIQENTKLATLMKDADFVFFLAWDIGGSKYLTANQQSLWFVQNNLKILTNTIDLLSNLNKPFIFTSSQMAEMPTSAYGLTKKLGEYLTQNLNGIFVRFWNVYGYEKINQKSHVIADLIYKAKESNNISLNTNGKEMRQFLHVKDCVECLITLSSHYDTLPRDKNYDVTSFQWTSIIDVALIIQQFIPDATISTKDTEDIVQRNFKLEPDPFILSYWSPKISLQDGISKLIKKY